MKVLLDKIRSAAEENDQVSIDIILEKIGRRSYGPVLLIAGLIILAPLVGDMPGVPTVMAVLVLLTSFQMLFRREHIWLPSWLLNRSVQNEKLIKGLDKVRKPAAFLDRYLKPRFSQLTGKTGTLAAAVACICVSAIIPVMEFVPFSANAAGITLVTFGLALIANDGLLTSLALLFTLGTFTLVIILLV